MFRHTYAELLSSLLFGDKAHHEINERTGQGIRSLPPTSFSIDLSNNILPVCGVRKTYPATAAAEVAWFIQGTKDPEFISRYAPIWDKFKEEDGTIEAAYGPRWRSHFGRDQLVDAIETLAKDPTDRRCWISTWDPATDGLGQPSKSVPCPVGFSLSIRDGRLNSALMIRSSDVFVGLPYDVMGHALLMRIIASSIGRTALGTMHVTLAHPHLYDVHKEMGWQAMVSPPGDASLIMPRDWELFGVEKNPEKYVQHIKELASFDLAAGKAPVFSCKPELVI